MTQYNDTVTAQALQGIPEKNDKRFLKLALTMPT